mgnify:CR=1 FL=1
MKKEIIQNLAHNFEDHSQITESGIEFWFARDLQQLLGYSEWRNFQKVIVKSKITCETTDNLISDHFVDVNKMVPLGSGSEREIEDIMLTRYACYLIAQNGDSRKENIAFAQNYFATEITVFNTKEKDLRNESSISNEHITNNKSVRKILLERGIEPENLPQEEDIKKLERRVNSEYKKLGKNPDKLN